METAIRAFKTFMATQQETPKRDSSTSPLASDEEEQLHQAILESVKSAASEEAVAVSDDGRAKKAVRDAGAVEHLAPIFSGGEIPMGEGSLAATFVSESILAPAGGVITPSSSFVKAWKLKNTGTLAWPAGTRLVNVGGDIALAGPASGVIMQEETAPGEQAAISATFTAPPVPGRFKSFWRLVTPRGDRFGHRVWVDIHVENSNAASFMASASTPPPSAPAAEGASDGSPGSGTGASVSEWDAALEELHGMGFVDNDEEARALLARFKGQISAVVEELFKLAGDQ